jgi:hypothetical protein
MFNCNDFNLLYALYPTHIFYHDSSFFNFSKYRRNALLGMTVSIAYDAHKMVAASQKLVTTRLTSSTCYNLRRKRSWPGSTCQKVWSTKIICWNKRIMHADFYKSMRAGDFWVCWCNRSERRDDNTRAPMYCPIRGVRTWTIKRSRGPTYLPQRFFTGRRGLSGALYSRR